MGSSTPQQWLPVSLVGFNTIAQEEKLPQVSPRSFISWGGPWEQDDCFCHIFLELLVTNNVFLHPQGILNPYKTVPS